MNMTKIVTLTDHIRLIKTLFEQMDLNEHEQSLVDVESYTKWINSLQSVIDEIKIAVDEKSNTLSDRMCPGNMTAEKYWKFYENIKHETWDVDLITGKVNQLIGFNMPACELFPGTGTFTSHLVSAEPLYIVDYYMENLTKVGQQFNDFYNNARLMKYEIKDFDLSQLPQTKLGMVVSFNYFLVKNLKFIVSWAEEIYKVLYSGGYFIFNFIPDNTVNGLNMVAVNRLCYVNPDQLIEQLTKIGYEIESIKLRNGYGSTICAKKPGQLNQIKVSANLARIIDKSTPLV